MPGFVSRPRARASLPVEARECLELAHVGLAGGKRTPQHETVDAAISRQRPAAPAVRQREGQRARRRPIPQSRRASAIAQTTLRTPRIDAIRAAPVDRLRRNCRFRRSRSAARRSRARRAARPESSASGRPTCIRSRSAGTRRSRRHGADAAADGARQRADARRPRDEVGLRDGHRALAPARSACMDRLRDDDRALRRGRSRPTRCLAARRRARWPAVRTRPRFARFESAGSCRPAQNRRHRSRRHARSVPSASTSA